MLRHLSSVRVRRWGSVIFALVAVVLVIVAIYERYDSFEAAVTRLRWSDIALAFALGILGLVANAMSWRATMRAVGLRLPFMASLRVFVISQLGKYVPGSVWPVVAQVELMKSRGASRSQSGTAALIAMAIGVVTSSSLGATLVVAFDDRNREQYWYVLVVAVLGLVALLPPVLTQLLRLVARLFKRRYAAPKIGWEGLGSAIAWSAAMWFFFGMHLWVLGRGLGADELSVWLSTGAFALAWVVGFVIVFAPAGVGVREAVLVVVLAPVLIEGDALAIAVVSRVLLTVIDGVAGGLGALASRRAS